jgi:hypothetical protein
MPIKEPVIEKLNDLPVRKQQEVLDFVEFLKVKEGLKTPRKS